MRESRVEREGQGEGGRVFMVGGQSLNVFCLWWMGGGVGWGGVGVGGQE